MANKKEKMFIDNRDKIIPVTFVKNEARANTDLNNLFVLPYDINSINVGNAVRKIDEVVKNQGDNEQIKNQVADFRRSMLVQTDMNLFDAIRGFISMNVKDVTVTFIIKFFNNNMPAYFKRYNAGTSDRVCNSIDEYIRQIDLCTGHPALTSIYYQQIAAGIFNNIVIAISNDISNICYHNCTVHVQYDDNDYDEDDDGVYRITRKIDYSKTFVGELFEKSYGTGTANSKVLSDPQFNYIFCTSVLRELLEKELPVLYSCIGKILESAAYMANANCVTPPESLITLNKPE